MVLIIITVIMLMIIATAAVISIAGVKYAENNASPTGTEKQKVQEFVIKLHNNLKAITTKHDEYNFSEHDYQRLVDIKKKYVILTHDRNYRSKETVWDTRNDIAIIIELFSELEILLKDITYALREANNLPSANGV